MSEHDEKPLTEAVPIMRVPTGTVVTEELMKELRARAMAPTPYYAETKPGWWPQRWRWIEPQTGAAPDIMDAVREVARG